jgi:hypothetical protein
MRARGRSVCWLLASTLLLLACGCATTSTSRPWSVGVYSCQGPRGTWSSTVERLSPTHGRLQSLDGSPTDDEWTLREVGGERAVRPTEAAAQSVEVTFSADTELVTPGGECVIVLGPHG